MKKKIALIFINIIVFFLILTMFDFLFYLKNRQDTINDVKKRTQQELGFNNKEYVNFPKIRYSLNHPSFESYIKKLLRDPNFKYRVSGDSLNNNKKSLLLFGDSFAEGAWLKIEDNLSHKITKYSQKPAYNLGLSGTGPSQMLALTQLNSFYKTIKIEPDYAIYIVIPLHYYRTYYSKYGIVGDGNLPYVGYKEIDDKLKKDNKPFINQFCRFYTVRKIIEKRLYERINKLQEDIVYKFIKLHFLEARKSLQKEYPNIKFIILKHPHLNYDPSTKEYLFYHSKMWKELEEEGFIVIDLIEYIGEEIKTKEYLLPDSHPNEKLWEVTSKKLIKDFDL